ncbi:MAG: hypothetical protein EA360_05135 [Balneolaceae bacterium]|nr:MAG: hypothetical protein EA360_05135 [Balneolaceae bacterium]
MLESTILHIRKSRLYNCSDSWRHRVSGNVLELSVNAGETTDKPRYRCSVITIGQVLKTLSDRIEANGSQYHIQSFPSLENPEIIASIRTDSSGFSPKNPYFYKPEGNENELPDKLLGILAIKYQFQLHPIPEETLPNEMRDPKIKNWFSLSSVFDNPFIWLNLGYMKEIFLHSKITQGNGNSLAFNDLCNLPDGRKPEIALQEKLQLQAIAGV